MSPSSTPLPPLSTRVSAAIELMRFRFHVSFVSVLAGALLFASDYGPMLWWRLLLTYLLFNVLLYGGIYALNDVVDREADAQHVTKKMRPIPSGRIGVGAAAVFAATLIALSFGLAWQFQAWLLPYLALFLLANLLYSSVLKPIPYAGLAAVAFTHSLRFALGMAVAGVAPQWPVLAGFYVLLLVITVTIHGLFNAKAAHRPFYPWWMLLLVQLVGVIGLVAAWWTAQQYRPVLALLMLLAVIFVLCAQVRGLRPILAKVFQAQAPQQGKN